MKNLFLLFLVIGTIFSCSKLPQDFQDEIMPTARGEIGEIILVIDSNQWNNSIGESLRSVLLQPMQGLPQDEPLFDLNKVSPLKLNSVLKGAANIIFVMTLDNKSNESRSIRAYFTDESLKKIQKDSSIFMSVKSDEFAKGQKVLFLYASTEDLLIEKIKQNRLGLQALFENFEQKRMVDKLFVKREKQLEMEIAEDYKFEIKVPFGWERAKSEEKFYWLRKLSASKEQNIFFYYEPYLSTKPFEDIPAFRDYITESFLRDSEKKDLFITRQERDDIKAVFVNQITFDGKYAKEARGLWKVSDNSAGGPYISYTIVDEQQNRLYYIEGYVYAPGGKKKNLIREVDAILSTFKPILSENNN